MLLLLALVVAECGGYTLVEQFHAAPGCSSAPLQVLVSSPAESSCPLVRAGVCLPDPSSAGGFVVRRCVADVEEARLGPGYAVERVFAGQGGCRGNATFKAALRSAVCQPAGPRTAAVMRFDCARKTLVMCPAGSPSCSASACRKLALPLGECMKSETGSVRIDCT